MKGITIKIVSVFLLLFFACFSCKDNYNGSVPYPGKVSFNISLNTGNLVHVSGYEYYTGGLRGVVVYRLDMVNFLAYDRACPYDWADGGYVVYDPATMTLNCEECGSSFNILDGYPKTGTIATSPLRMYLARMIDDYTVHISN
jgi:hypothetical protein